MWHAWGVNCIHLGFGGENYKTETTRRKQDWSRDTVQWRILTPIEFFF